MEENEDSFIVRVGTFLMIMGGGVFILFVISDIADQVDFNYLFVALLLIFIGWNFRRKKAPSPPTGRFASIRNLRKNAKNKRAEKSNPKKE